MEHMTKEDWDRLRDAQERECNLEVDIITIIRFMRTREEVLEHIERYEQR